MALVCLRAALPNDRRLDSGRTHRPDLSPSFRATAPVSGLALLHGRMEILSEVRAVGAALGRQAVDTENRAPELELSDAPKEIAAADNLLFKEH